MHGASLWAGRPPPRLVDRGERLFVSSRPQAAKGAGVDIGREERIMQIEPEPLQAPDPAPETPPEREPAEEPLPIPAR